MMGPMTFIVLVVLLVFFFLGISVLLRRPGTDREDLQLGTQSPCPHCRKLNPTHAKFCGQCGKKLD